MSSPGPVRFTAAKARTSCQRCYRRKKRCDRSLPQCGNCKSSNINCSFLDDDRQVGSYPVAFVQGLENRVRELEKALAFAATTLPAPPSSRGPHMSDAGTVVPSELGSQQGAHQPPGSSAASADTVVVPASESSITATSSQMQVFGPVGGSGGGAGPGAQPGSLFDELKFLSLEATAERYLGSSSGFSFARLTQAVLRRLSPDRADFVFAADPDSDAVHTDPTAAATTAHGSAGGGVTGGAGGTFGLGIGLHDRPLFDFASPSDALNSIFNTFENSLACYPTTFGILPLAELAEPDDILATVTFPDDKHLHEIVEFYFAHSHTLYPIIHRGEFMVTLDQIRLDPQLAQQTLPQYPLAMFRAWMVLAIGSTAQCSVMLSEESEPMLYYNKAMSYFEAAFEFGDMAALEALMLQVSYSFFSQLGPNTWFLIGLAARMAVGMGLHTASTYESLPVDTAQRRKKLFFSIYMMDRVASMALGRPFALHDDDIDVSPFADANEEDIQLHGIQPPSSLLLEPSLMSVPLHILALRRIASKIATQVYSQSRASRVRSPERRQEIIRELHRELVEWRRNMPFPLPDIHPTVPHLSSSWFDFNFYTHLAMLYRPSPLYPTLDRERVKLLAHAAAMSIRQAINMHRQQRLAYNWLNLLSVFTAALSLVYAVTAQPDDLRTFLRETKAIDDLESATQLFDLLSNKFAAAKKIGRMIQQIVGRYKDLCAVSG